MSADLTESSQLVEAASGNFSDMLPQRQLKVQPDTQASDKIRRLYCFQAYSETEIFISKFGDVMS